MKKPKSIINEVKLETKKLATSLRRNKDTLVSSETLGLALELVESIKQDRVKAKKIKQELKTSANWPFPKFNGIN